MDDPAQEIARVVSLLTTAATPELQAATIDRYFTPDAGFTHPLCAVAPNPSSREEIKGVYQWYRHMSPILTLDVESVVYDEAKHVVYLSIAQTFHIFASPFRPTPARLLVRVTLHQKPHDGKYYIAQQEDFYQPEDILYLTLPFLGRPFVLVKKIAAKFCYLNAGIAASLGLGRFWRPDPALSASEHHDGDGGGIDPKKAD